MEVNILGSITNTHYPRMKKAEYEKLKKEINREYFYNYYLNNCNDYICKKFNINLSTVSRLVKDFEIKLTDEQIRQKIKIATEQKCLERYGVVNPFASKKVQEKIKETNIAKYGVENPFAAEEIKNKIKQTSLEKYGVKYTSQSSEVKQKIRETCLEKYGVDNYAKTQECRQKTIETLLERYGRDNVGQFGSPEHEAAIIEKYGVNNVGSLEEIKEKSRQTSFAKYGVTHYSKTTEFHKRLRKRYRYEEQYFDSLPEVAV